MSIRGPPRHNDERRWTWLHFILGILSAVLAGLLAFKEIPCRVAIAILAAAASARLLVGPRVPPSTAERRTSSRERPTTRDSTRPSRAAPDSFLAALFFD